MSELLKISGLSGGYKKGVEILHGIDLSVNSGESVGILGLNGSGKSTLGKAVMNMIPIRRGEILFEGRSVTALPTYELYRHGMAIMQQGGLVFRNLSVWDNLHLAFPSGINDTFDGLRDMIPMLRVSEKELRHQMADKLSGGQRHQLALAMTLASHAKLVILDEPSAGLAPKAVDEMYGILEKVRKDRGVAIILIEQNIARAVEFCDSCRLLALGRTERVFDKGTELSEIENELFNIKERNEKV